MQSQHPTIPLREITLEEWFALDEDEEGELVNGRLEEEEVADAIHELVVTWLAAVFRNWLRGRGGVVLGSDAKYAVGAGHGRKPDLSVYLPGSPKPPGRGLIRIPPDIAVEVVSRSPKDERRDRIFKTDEYAAFGVRFYWLINPALSTLEVFELLPSKRYQRVLAVTNGNVPSVPGCEGMTLDLDDVWGEVQGLAPEG